MRVFIIRFFTFSLVLLVVFLILQLGISYIVNDQANFELDKRQKFLVLGHSHPECAFNDSLIPNFRNLAQSGESYLYTLAKAKKLIPKNPSIKVVFIEFTNNQIQQDMDQWIWSKKQMNYRYPTYAPFLTLYDQYLLAIKNPKVFLNSSSISLRQNIYRISTNDLQYSKEIGGYLSLKKTSLKKPSNFNNSNDEGLNNAKLSYHNVNYLEKLVNFLKKNNVDPILIRSPLHKQYPRNINEKNYLKLIRSKFPEIDYLDFSEFYLTDDNYGDLGHLNHKGSEAFSKWFANLLEENLLNMKNKQLFINQEIDEFRRAIKFKESSK